jgi:hypothetical protein
MISSAPGTGWRVVAHPELCNWLLAGHLIQWRDQAVSPLVAVALAASGSGWHGSVHRVVAAGRAAGYGYSP